MEQNEIKRLFKAKSEELEEVNNFVLASLPEGRYSPKSINELLLCIEEIFVNIVSYGYPKTEGPVEVTVSNFEDSSSIKFEDQGIKFNPLAKSDPNVTLAPEERSIGGLGIFLVKKLMSNVTYSYENDHNILTISKNADSTEAK